MKAAVRRFDPEDKRRLIEVCQRPGVSVSGLALKAGVNANQLRKWVKRESGRQRSELTPICRHSFRSWKLYTSR